MSDRYIDMIKAEGAGKLQQYFKEMYERLGQDHFVKQYSGKIGTVENTGIMFFIPSTDDLFNMLIDKSEIMISIKPLSSFSMYKIWYTHNPDFTGYGNDLKIALLMFIQYQFNELSWDGESWEEENMKKI